MRARDRGGDGVGGCCDADAGDELTFPDCMMAT